MIRNGTTRDNAVAKMRADIASHFEELLRWILSFGSTHALVPTRFDTPGHTVHSKAAQHVWLQRRMIAELPQSWRVPTSAVTKLFVIDPLSVEHDRPPTNAASACDFANLRTWLETTLGTLKARQAAGTSPLLDVRPSSVRPTPQGPVVVSSTPAPIALHHRPVDFDRPPPRIQHMLLAV